MCDLAGELTNTDHYPVVANVRVRLVVGKQTSQKFDVGS
jgi:hypothetical protein